jgi:DOPA 4,5-dioxygenase
MSHEDPELYHLHIYFNDASEAAALDVRAQVLKRPEVLGLGRFHERPVGPHPVRQFQILLAAKDVEAFVPWLDEVRNNLDVLIHPEIGDDLLAHTELVQWLGNAHPLKLDGF